MTDTSGFMLSPEVEASINLEAKLKVLQEKLRSKDLVSALNDSLALANYVADAMNDPERKLLIEKNGKFIQLQPAA